MSSIEVRPAGHSDVEAMAAIYVNAAREGWAHFLGESSVEALQPPVDRLRAELASADARHQILVAEREGRVFAFAVVRASQDDDADGLEVGELDQFYSEPAVWGKE
jgi:L-amino acid N-acyltransferase YncA